MRMALLGASGCGKSVTLKCIAGIMTPDRGQIIHDGETLFDSEKHINLPPQKRRIGYLFQQYALFPNMTVLQNIRCGIRSGSRAEKRPARRRSCAASGWKGWRKSTRLSSPADSSSARRSYAPFLRVRVPENAVPGERTTAAFNILTDKCLCYK